MVKSYTLAGTAACICLFLAVCAVISTIHILRDIGNFYNEAQEELIEFKDIANNVWDEMVFESTPEEMREAEDLDREKRSYDAPEEYDPSNPSTTTPATTTRSTTPRASSATALYPGDESSYDSTHDNGPPSSRPRKPEPPTMPRTIQGFRAPPPAATSTYRPPSGQNYDNYGREPASSRRPYVPYQQPSTAAPYNTPNNRTFFNPKPQTNVRTPYTRVPYNPPNYTQQPQTPGHSRAPYSYTNAPNTPPPRDPSGGYDSDGKVPPNWPKVYNTRRPNLPGPDYPEDQVHTVTPSPGQQRVSPTQSRNPQYPDQTTPQQPGRNYPRQPSKPVPPPGGRTDSSTPPPVDEIPPGRTGSRPGFGPQRPRFPSGPRQRVNPCDQCSAQPNTCPSGPPGPRGRPGPPGFPGQDGPRGLRGLNGGYAGVHPASYDPVIGCVQCPVGPPGERGADGPPGAPGEDGIDGEQGVNGQDGQPGAPGAPGYHGINGVAGAAGKPGTPGRNGQSCRSIPGPPGQPGIMGAPGRDGDPGTDGEHGQDGSPGIQGPPGNDGLPGPDGPQGTSSTGPPGTDGGYCPCPKRSSKFDFNDASYTDDEKSPREQRPREHSTDRAEEPRSRLPSHSQNYEENSGYERQRKPTYDTSSETTHRESRYEEEEKPREPAPRRPPPQRQQPRPDHREYSNEQERRPQEGRREYEPERSADYYGERSKPERSEEHSSGYRSGDDRRAPASYDDRRPIEQPRYEDGHMPTSRNRPLKKVEINRNSDRGYDNRPSSYDHEKPRDGGSSRYEPKSEPYYEEEHPKKEAHPPGFGRPKSEEERREQRTHYEESMPPVKQTDLFNGEKRKNQPEYEDISRPDEEKDKAKHQRRPNKFQEKQWEEHRKSQELRNSREHGGEIQHDTVIMQQVKPVERDSSVEEKSVSSVHDNFQSSEKRFVPKETSSLPSEQIPYRRKTRFYRNHYYEKFLI